MSVVRAVLVPLVLGLFAVSCDSSSPDTVTLVVPAAQAPLFEAFAEPLGGRLSVRVADDPAAEAARLGGGAIGVVADLPNAGSYRLESGGDAFVVHGDAPLGIQYGVAALLEARGWRFFHPFRSHLPARLAAPDPGVFGSTHEPEQAVRGLHLHTLHPIEGYFDFWEPGPDSLARAEQTIDWLVKNRGNYLQWPALDDVQSDPARRDAVRAHVKAIVDYAHLRGVRIGVGIQLFGRSNLQHAFDLLDQDGVDPTAAFAARLPALEGLGLDAVQLSFGEFFGADPATFVSTLDLAVATIRSRFPGAEVSAVVHVGNFPTLDVTYMGTTQLYYYLVKYASDPALVPYIHTVMYYDLFEDAGGAYGYDSFDGHRQYLFDRLSAGQPVVYFPESAYWIAFDNSLPMYLPLYLRSRHQDFAGIRAHAQANGHADLDGHVLFSSGWEWGYWQTDRAVLRMGYELPSTWESALDEIYAPWGARGAQVSSILAGLVDDLHTGLMMERLAPWVASRDFTFDAGDLMGVFSQPRRASYAEVAAMGPAELATFRSTVLEPLEALRDSVAARRAALEALGLPDDLFLRETVDGVAVDHERLAFVSAIVSALVAHASGDDATATAELAEAESIRARAKVVIDRRHHDTLHPEPSKILSEQEDTAGIYDYGYLREAVRTCFYERELVDARNAILGESAMLPFCAVF